MADLEIKLIGEDSSPGSNYINNELRNDIYSTLMTYGMFNKFKVVRTNTKETSLPLTTARPVASWVTTEGTGPSADTTKAGSLGSLTMGELIANIPVSLRLIEDADIDIVGDLINDLGEAFAYAIDNTLFNAETTNNATYGGFNGIVNQAGVTTAASGNVSVQTLDYDDFVDAYAALDSGVIQRGVAEWFMNPVLLAVSAKIKDTTGRPIFGTALDVPNAKTIANIIGLPANPVGVLASTNTTSTKVAFVGDPMGAAVGIRKDLAIESSDHSGWVNATRDVRGRLRAGVLVRKAGAFRALRTAAS
jgi:HK97 family phage major capsid protein